MSAQSPKPKAQSLWAVGVLLASYAIPTVALAGQPCGTAAPPVPEGRPRIGLALGGGSARGLAHVGVLEWLEEHRIPVDLIAGTSIGGLIGGGYATGRSAAEVRTLIEGIDWDAMFRGEVDYALKTFRRKEDRRDFPVRLDLGLRDGLRLAPGLDPGHEVELFLSRLAVPYTAPMCFDDLPIPFRAVATDLEAASVEALAEGSLGTALRATMAIPGIFQPIERDDLLLTDGGLLNNVPADVTRTMGADVVIAVDVSAPLESREALSSLVAVANQAIGVMMVQRTRAVLETNADHVITPALEDIGADGWREFETIRARGYAAADAVAGSLAAFSLAPADWARHLEARRRRRSTTSVELTFVRVDGVGTDIAADIVRRLEPAIGGPLDPEGLERWLTMLAGAGRYGSLGYDLAAGYLRRVGRLPDLLGGPIYLGAWLESGSAFETPRDAVVHSDLSGGVLVETLMGALLVSGSIGDDGSSAFYVALGRPFW